jgi:hypothetical protein
VPASRLSVRFAPLRRTVLTGRPDDRTVESSLRNVLDAPDDRILLYIDVIVGTLLHRMGMTGRPMDAADVAALTEMVVRHFA